MMKYENALNTVRVGVTLRDPKDADAIARRMVMAESYGHRCYSAWHIAAEYYGTKCHCAVCEPHEKGKSPYRFRSI